MITVSVTHQLVTGLGGEATAWCIKSLWYYKEIQMEPSFVYQGEGIRRAVAAF